LNEEELLSHGVAGQVSDKVKAHLESVLVDPETGQPFTVKDVNAATVIQGKWRTRAATLHVEEHRQNKAAIRLQCAWKAKQARRAVAAMRALKSK
jgi:hypothetical protein